MRTTLVATSHGTDVLAARWSMSALVGALADALPGVCVREAFVDVQEPRVEAVVEEVIGAAVVLPLLLAPGFHVRTDIGRAAKHASTASAATLGPDRRLAGLLSRRLSEAGAAKDDTIVLGAAGSTDASARESVEAEARMLSEIWGSDVRVGYTGGSGERLDDVVREARSGRRRIVVASYLMAPGYFYGLMTECGADLVTRPLLDGAVVAPEMVAVAVDRFSNAARDLEASIRVRQ